MLLPVMAVSELWTAVVEIALGALGLPTCDMALGALGLPTCIFHLQDMNDAHMLHAWPMYDLLAC